MKKTIRSIFILALLVHAPLASKPCATLFQSSTTCPDHSRIATNPRVLLKAARYAKKFYFNSTNPRAKQLTKSTLLDQTVISPQETKETLDFIINTIEYDLKHYKNKFRILNPRWLEKHVSFIKWRPDRQEARRNNRWLPMDKIRLTSYAVFRCNGSCKKTAARPHALYEITSKRFNNRFRTTYSKQNILKGILERGWFKGHVEPLVWLSREHLEQALMQGSTIVTTPDGKEHLFNVEISNVSAENNFAYNKTVKNSWNQKKYWYFKKITKSGTPQEQRVRKLIDLGGASFAGDVENIGLGKIIALRYRNCMTGQKELKLGVLADRGSAFTNNLYQLDLFAGIFDNRNQFNRFIRQFPETVEAYIMKRHSLPKRHSLQRRRSS